MSTHCCNCDFIYHCHTDDNPEKCNYCGSPLGEIVDVGTLAKLKKVERIVFFAEKRLFTIGNDTPTSLRGLLDELKKAIGGKP